MPNSPRLLPLLAFAALSALSASAATVFSDDFADGRADGWFFSSKGALDAVSTDGLTLGSGSALAYFKPLTLGRGDSVTLHFTVTFPAIPGPDTGSGNGFRFGLFNSRGQHASGYGDDTFAGYDGFIVTTSPATISTSSNGKKGPTAAVFRQRVSGLKTAGAGRLLSTTSEVYEAAGHKSAPLARDFPAATPLSATLTFTRASTTELTLSLSIAAGSKVLQSHTQTVPARNFSFDTLAINAISTLGAFVVDDVSVTTP